MIINHNMSAMNANRQMATNQSATAKSTEKLSSGLRINRAGDDAAGLAISEKMRAQISGLDQATRNAQDGISMIQTAEGALNESHSILQRMRELSVQSANDTNTDDDRAELQKEVEQLTSELDRISTDTEFNTKKLLNGDLSGSSIGGKGSEIGNATSASVSVTFDPDNFDASGSQNMSVKIDGNTYELQGVTGADAFAWATDFKDKLTTAMKDAGVAEENIPSVEITNIVDQNTMDLVITSKKTGTDSNIEIKFDYDKDNTDEIMEDSIQDLLNKVESTGSNGKLNEAITIADGDKLELEVNGHKLDVALTAKEYTQGNELEGTGSLAEQLKQDIQTALDDYKALTGTDFGNVSVDVKDGAFVISSDKADTTNIKVKLDNVSNKLGLGGTSTSSEGGVTLQIGANKDQSIALQINDMSASALNVKDTNVATQDGANNAITSIDAAIKNVSAERSKLGATQNRLEHTINNLGTSSENLTAAESRIRDVDMAKEMMEFTKNNVLSQASQAMLAQAKALPNQVLSLLQ